MRHIILPSRAQEICLFAAALWVVIFLLQVYGCCFSFLTLIIGCTSHIYSCTGKCRSERPSRHRMWWVLYSIYFYRYIGILYTIYTHALDVFHASFVTFIYTKHVHIFNRYVFVGYHSVLFTTSINMLVLIMPAFLLSHKKIAMF